jgi:hypothetical protein
VSEKDINRWQDTITPRDKAPQPWTIKSGGSWDMLEVQPIPDSMLAELAERYYYAGTPWNCRSMPLSASDREYMYLLYYSMQGLVARMRQAEKKEAESADELTRLRAEVEALRANDRRYRHLREHGDAGCTEKDGYGGQQLRVGADLDAHVDAAVAKVEAGND